MAFESSWLHSCLQELRTPLNAILGFSEMIKQEGVETIQGRYPEWSGLIHRAGLDINETLETILELLRFDAGYIELNEESIDVEEVIQDALRVTTQAAKRQIILTAVPSTIKLPRIYGDRERLQKILVKILSETPKIAEISIDLSDGLDIIIKQSGRFDTDSFALTWARVLMERLGGHYSIVCGPDLDITVLLSFPPKRVMPNAWSSTY